MKESKLLPSRICFEIQNISCTCLLQQVYLKHSTLCITYSGIRVNAKKRCIVIMMVISEIHRLPRLSSVMAYCTEQNICEISKAATQLRGVRGYSNYIRHYAAEM